MFYNKSIEWGNTIYSGNRIYQYITYEFNSIQDLKEFWQSRSPNIEGDWSANIKRLTIQCVTTEDANTFFETIGEEE